MTPARLLSLRHAFLAVSLLAAYACSSSSERPPPSSDDGAGGMAGAGGKGGSAGAVQPEGGTDAAKEAAAGGGGDGGAGGVTQCPTTGGAGTQCLGDAPTTLADCSLMNIGKSCQTEVQTACTKAIAAFRSEVAGNAVDCMSKLVNPCVGVLDCDKVALASACGDTGADAPCAALATRCPEISAVLCHEYLDGLQVPARTTAATCLSNATCGCAMLDTCLGQL